MTTQDLEKLTPEMKRVRIAIACGWTNIGVCTCGIKSRGTPPDGVDDKHLPDYLGDLNAIQKAIARLTFPQKALFGGALQMEVMRDETLAGEADDENEPVLNFFGLTAITELPASKLADAFLLTVG